MKKLSITFLFLSLCIVSCIPSLHPIFTDNTRIDDDRIIGNWYTDVNDVSYDQIDITSEGKKIKLNNVKIDLDHEVTQDDYLEVWKFDRAAHMRYVKTDTYGNEHNTLSDNKMMSRIDSGLVEKGFVLDSIEKLPYYILEYKNMDINTPETEYMVINLTTINGQNYIDFSPYQDSDIGNVSRFSTNFIPGHTFAKYYFKDGNLVIQSFDSDYIEELIQEKRVRLKHEIVDESIVLTASTEELRAFISKYGHDENLYLDEEMLITIN